ncbi:uncharacterized protein LOC125533158 [Triticum urartu]|uniref:uncharacterized protein LOC125533158 n=1 Tax=Triticum urartu TaxID=4572 RepID=UPI002043F23E|nr:uncharacterized protein LOC125533158 [Triticum urartu]
MGAPEKKPNPPPAILVPRVFDFPPAAARTKMSVPAYDLMFGKLSLRALFHDYFHQPGKGVVDAGLLFRAPLDDTRVDLAATMSKNGGEALMRWQRDVDDPHNFVDILASTSKRMLRLRSAAYYPSIGIGAFGTFPLLMENRASSEDYGVMGLRYVSRNLSIGASFLPFPFPGEVPYGAWLVGRKGNFSAGLQYKPLSGSNHAMPFTDLKNWNCAISYGMRSTSPLDPSLLFALELVRNTQLVASVYQHHILLKQENERRGNDHITGRLSYLDFGLELATRVNEDKPVDNADKSMFQIAGSWQLNENLLVKAKAGPSKSSAALALKFKPFFTASVTVENDHLKGTRSYGFGIHARDDETAESGYQSVYQTVDPDTSILTQTKVNFNGESKKRKFQFDSPPGNFENLPTELKPVDGVL